MKKFLVGMLSIFVLLGASILAACGSSKIELTLSQESISILYDSSEPSQEVVVASVTGGKNVEVVASPSNSYENIISASASNVGSNRWEITITALNEGYGEVVVMTNQGNVSKIISVDVYTEVTSMEQNFDEKVVRKNYAIRGETTRLIEENLLSFQPSNLSRRTITWTVQNPVSGVTIDGQMLTIDESVQLDEITLVATTENNISTTVTLPILDNIAEDLSLSWSYSLSGTFTEINSDYNTFALVPNDPDDPNYTGYVKLNYNGDLVITPRVTLANSNEDDGFIHVNSLSQDDNGYPIYAVFVDRQVNNINRNYQLYFEVGYEDYDYNIDTSASMINLQVREVVNDIEIRGEDNSLIANSEITSSVQTLYSQYHGTNGEMFNILVLPTTVQNYSNSYRLELTTGSLGEPIMSDNTSPVVVQYYDSINYVWQEVSLIWDESKNAYLSNPNINLSASTIYLKAHPNLLVQTASNLQLRVISTDNETVSASINLELVRAVTEEQFNNAFNDADTTFIVDSSPRATALTIAKTFTLVGQSDIRGLSVETNSQHISLTQPRRLSSSTDSVTFEIVLTLNPSSIGVTSQDSYRFIHANGLVSRDFEIDIFLPLTEAAVVYDQGSNLFDSVTYSVNSNLVYSDDGSTAASTESLSRIMIKNGSTIPLLYQYNYANGNYAVGNVQVNYYDLDFVAGEDGILTEEEKSAQIDAFEALLNTPEGRSQIIASASENTEIGKYAYFSLDNSSIITTNVGFTYAVVSFTGKGITGADEDGNITIKRIILIESYISPSTLAVTPNTDREVGLYASDTVSSTDTTLTRKTITIDFRISNVTYTSLDNFRFVSTAINSQGNAIMGEGTVNGNSVSWDNGRYVLENIVISDHSMTFDIVSLLLQGASSFSDNLNVYYQLDVLNSSGALVKRDILSTTISVVIRSAQRIESLQWEGEDEEGLYFELGESEPQFIVLTTSPSDARNKNISYLITNSTGQVDYANSIVTVGDYLSQNRLALTLNADLSQGITGYIYLLPQDAIYNGQISYYLTSEMTGEQPIRYTVSFDSLGQIRSGSQTWYDYLIENAYFISNASIEGEQKNISFADILLKIKITVADGRSFEHAYRIYTAEEFTGRIALNPQYFYRVMNSFEVNYNGAGITLTGGIEGRAYDDLDGNRSTITFDNSNVFIGENSGTIRNIIFNGEISSSNGFVANTNSGTIENVTVDVNGTYPSSLSGNGQYIGGIVGQNSGTISNSSVLGLSITGGTGYVGGIAGRNSGTITGSRVEFYNLSKENTEETGINTFTGAYIGGLVGEAQDGSTLTLSYAYNYASTSPFAGFALIATSSGTITVDQVFAYGISNTIIGTNATVQGEYYNVYEADGTYDESTTAVYYEGRGEDLDLSDNYIKPGEEGFLTYVNNGGAYFRNIYQAEKVQSLDTAQIQTITDINGYYKSLAVKEESSDDSGADTASDPSLGRGILFYYAIEQGIGGLTQSALNDLDDLNTISLSELISIDNLSTDYLIITSSNSGVLRIIGSDIKILGTGSVELKLYSKQDVSINKTFEIEVIYSMSQPEISWTDSSGRTNIVSENSISYLQRTTTRYYVVTYQNPYVILGNQATEYSLIRNNMTIKTDVTPTKTDVTPTDGTAVSCEPSGNIITVTAEQDSDESKITVITEIFGDTDKPIYQEAINAEFNRTFTIRPTDGVIEFSVSEGGLSITPSTNAVVRVMITTTADDDDETITPQLRDENNILLPAYTPKPDGDYAKYDYIYYLATDQSTPFMGAYISLASQSDSSNGQYSFIFEITFEITQAYRSLISRDQSFDVSFISHSGNDSYYQTEGSATFKLNLSKQNFTNINISNYLISQSQWQSNNNGYITVHTISDPVGVLAPGGSSVMQIAVNPDYAYYDYMTLSYSGVTVNDAVHFELLSPYGTSNNQFTPNSSADYEIIGDRFIYRPTREEKEEGLGSLYFRIWINTTVNEDSIIRFTASFYQDSGEKSSEVNYYLTISYLETAEITVNGEDITYVARGSTADVQIRVPHGQNLESVVLDGNERGINISSLSEGATDPVSQITTYTAQIFVSVLASAENTDNSFSVSATVSQTVNGTTERKTTSATIKIVDFMVDEENVEIVGSENDALTVWLNVPKPFDIEYNFVPESYTGYSTSEQEALNKIQELLTKRNEFSASQLYSDSKSDFHINYRYEGRIVTPVPLSERIFFVNGNEHLPAFGSSSQLISFSQDSAGNISVTGLQRVQNIPMVVYTYILSGGYTRVVETYFTINVNAYSDPDIPLLIEDAQDFKNLNPDLYSSSDNITQDDYILMNDIILSDYTPFNTSLIRSLDGNGYTIHIKNFNIPSANTINLSLFTNVFEGTTLKNVRVNLYNGGQTTIDISAFSGRTTINVAGMAIENNGVITNSEVVAYRSEKQGYGDIENVLENTTTLHSNPAGVNIKFIRGANTTEEVYIGRNSSWTPTIAGFVLTNYGSITNSRVGGESLIELGNELYSGDIPSGYTEAYSVNLGTFYIQGQGDIAGFVHTNNGAISASSVQNLDIQNKSGTSGFTTSGFVDYNGTNAQVQGSFVEGVQSTQPNISSPVAENYTREGSSLKSSVGIIAGFVNNNEGAIQDSYSNILIANEIDENLVYLASGFVYQNNGRIQECYSASQIRNAMYSQMNFSGVNEEGELLANGTYINCYFFNKSLYQSDDAADSTTESQYSTGAIPVKDPMDSSYYYGFALASGDLDGIWRIDQDGPTLIESTTIAYSHRYIYYLDENSGYEGVTGENEEGIYILPYSTLQVDGTSREINTALGSILNPILIADAQDFIEVMGTSTSTNISQYYNNSMVWGTYRLVNDIDLSQLADSSTIPSINKAFSGRIYGNGFEINGISITSDANRVSFGLFSSLEPRGSYKPLITNLSLQIDQVVAGNSVMVGGLAGYAKDAYLINIDIAMSQTGQINANNFAGTLVGLAFGDNIIKNVTVDSPNVSTNQYNATSTTNYLSMENLYNFRNELKNGLNFATSIQSSLVQNNLYRYSYAGGVIGFADNYVVETNEFNINQADSYSINNVRVSGIVRITGEVAGGVIGLSGYQTHVNDVGVDIQNASGQYVSRILSMKYFAGGVIGQSFGGLSRLYVQYDSSTQTTIESGLSDFYATSSSVERGSLDLFYDSNTNYTQQYIGGLVGFVGSGKLEISYSKINVISSVADYAGGIIGGMELDGATGYNADADLLEASVYTKYFINEVYATGDVRAEKVATPSTSNVNAGGIIGIIKGNRPEVALLSVNAFNYVASYDYSTSTDITPAANMSYSLQLNLILGTAMVQTNNTWMAEELNANNYTSYLKLLQAQEINVTGGSAQSVPSIGIYEGYYLAGNSYTKLNLFGGQAGEITDPIADNTLFSSDIVFAINSPYNYNSISVGQIETNTAFLGSGAWVSENWNHPTSTLFPTIKYQRINNVVYLDQYNVASVFALMNNNSDIVVIVRGLQEKGGDESKAADVDLAAYNKANQDDHYDDIEGFGGRIVGGNYNGKTIGIIAEDNFIKSVSPGFAVSNLTVTYTSNSEQQITFDTSDGGLFVASDIDQATITGLTLNVLAPVVVSDTNTSSSIGLVAPRISNTNINSLTIKTNAAGHNSAVSSSNYLLSVNDRENLASDFNVGLVAGEIEQSSSFSTMYVEDITIETSANFFGISGPIFPNSSADENTESPALNIGTYFGLAQRDSSQNVAALDLRISLSTIKRPSSNTTQLYQRLNVSGISNNANINMGGYIGKANNLSYIGLYRGEEITTAFAHEIDRGTGLKVGTDLNVNAGLIVGDISNSSLGQTDFVSSELEGGLYVYNGATLASLNAGGFAGKMEGGNVRLSDIATINFEVLGGNLNNNGSRAQLDINNFEDYTDDYTDDNNMATVTVVEANVGGVIGYINAQFTLTNSERLNINHQKTQTISGSSVSYGDSIRLNASGEVNVGSVVGYAGVLATGANSTSFLVQGAITSEANFYITNAPTSNIGGIVGNIKGSTSNNPYSRSSTSITEVSNGLLRYNGGAFVSTAGTVNFGGVVGRVQQSHINVAGTSFGGALKILGDSTGATAHAGGVIGSIGEGGTSDSLDVDVQSTYNYGDVFVQYDGGFTSLSKYYFGGLIGYVNGITHDYDISSNYSLMTSHNARYSELEQTSHALFGNESLTGNTSSSTSPIANNYYSYALTLTEDTNGTDSGAYSVQQNGFTGGVSALLNNSVAQLILDELDDGDSIATGHKLNPYDLGSGGQLSDDGTAFNGMKYYQITNNSFVNQLNIGTGTANSSSELKNVAIIGDSTFVDYTTSGLSKSLIDTLSGHSFVSGLVLNIEIDAHNIANNSNIENNLAGLVNIMDENSQLYAIEVTGSISVGGTGTVKLGGLVAQFNSGKITNSSTAIDLVYRAGADGGVYGIAGLGYTAITGTTIKNIFIDNTYSTGSVTTYIDTSMYAFANGSSSAKISNSYSIAKLDWNDYTTASKMTSGDTAYSIGVFGKESALKNCYYDKNAINLTLSSNIEGAIEKNTLQLMQKSNNSNNNDNDNEIFKNKGSTGAPIYTESDFNFNYGYPTLKYDFMKLSSYATATSFTSGKDQTESDTSIFSSNITSITYDDYVEEVVYERLGNNTLPAVSNYFMIPNAGVLSLIGSGEGVSAENFVLLYDMDLKNTEFSSSWRSLYPKIETAETNEDSTTPIFDSGVFDGNGKTISGLKDTLFGGIYGGVIKNLRLTDATIKASPVFAESIAGGEGRVTISNITLSGNISGTLSNAIQFGALANGVINTDIYAVTNLTSITLTATPAVAEGSESTASTMSIGGIVGFASGTKIKFSSNYGPLTIVSDSAKTGVNDFLAVGGLVGQMFGTSISYSYNSASVLNGYATNTALSTVTGNYYTGGIVAYVSASHTDNTISNSYNSGMIKSGNKSNGTTYSTTSGTTSYVVTQGVSYAGGIIGRGYNDVTSANTVSITGCYNEGSVEALGVNAEFSFRWAADNNQSLAERLEMYQSSLKNVWAYGIGYYNDTTNNNYTVAEDNNIFENGASATNGTVFLTEEWDTIAENVTEEVPNIETNEARVSISEIVIFLNKFRVLNHSYKFSLSIKQPTINDTPSVTVNNYDSMGVPTRMIVTVNQTYSAQYHAAYGESAVVLIPIGLTGLIASAIASAVVLPALFAALVYHDSQAYTSTTQDMYVLDFEKNARDEKGNYYNRHSRNKASTSSYSSISSGLDGLKESTRSKESENRTDFNSIEIAGKSYYLADSNNIEKILQAGIYTGVITVTSRDLLYTGNVNDYTATVTVDGTETISNSISSVSLDGDNTVLEIRIFTDREEGLTGDFTVTVSCDYEESFTFSPEDLDYVYIDDKSLGLRIDNVNLDDLLQEEGVQIGTTQDVYKFTTEEEGKGETLYLYYDEKHQLFVYRPNTTLNNSSTTTINANAGFDSNITNWEIKSENQNIGGITYTFSTQTNSTDDGYLVATFTSNTQLNNTAIASIGGSLADTLGNIVAYSHNKDSYADGSYIYNLFFTTKSNSEDTFDVAYNGNTIASFNSKRTHDYFVANISKLTGVFSGKTLYAQYRKSGTEQVEVTYNGLGSGTITHNISDITGEVTFGEEVNNWYTSTSSESTQNADGNYTHTISYTLNTFAEDTIVVNGDTPVFGYNANTRGWIKAEDDSVVINGNIYSIRLTGNILTLSITNENSTHDFGTVIAVINNFHAYQGSQSMSVTGHQTSPLSLLNANVSIEFVYNNLTYTVDNAFSISQSESDGYYHYTITQKDATYTLGDIKVYRGTANYKLSIDSVTYTDIAITYTGILDASLTISDGTPTEPESFTGYVDTPTTTHINLGADGNGHTFDKNDSVNSISLSFESSSTYRFNQKDIKGENSEFGIYLQDNNNSNYYVKGTIIEEKNSYSTQVDKIYQAYGNDQYISVEYSSTSQTIQDNDGTQTTVKTQTYGVSLGSKTENEWNERVLFSLTITDIGDSERHYHYSISSDLRGEKHYVTYSLPSTNEDLSTGYYTISDEGKNVYYDINGGYLGEATPMYLVEQGETLSLIPLNGNIPEGGTIKDEVDVVSMDGQNFMVGDYITLDNRSDVEGYYKDNEDGPSQLLAQVDAIIGEFTNANEFITFKTSKNMGEYIKVDSHYTVLNNQSTPAYITQNIYNWTAFDFSEYASIEQELRILNSQFNKINFTAVGSENGIFKFGDQNEGDSNGNIEIQMLLAGTGSSAVTITTSVKEGNNKIERETITDGSYEDSTLTILIATDGKPLDPQPIIFTQDVSIQGMDAVTLHGDVNIIGNGYFLSSYDTLFYGVGSATGSSPFIKDLLILNETYNKTFLISDDNQDGNLLTINNVKLYGSVSNYNQSNPALIAEQTSISDLDTYVSINSILKSGSAGGTLILFNGSGLNASQNIGTNYGVLVAANGDDGANGTNASSAAGSITGGTAGCSGGSIQAFSQTGDSSQASPLLSNQGILKVGDGGNGGAGGSTYYVLGKDGVTREGVSLDRFEYYQNVKAGSGGDGGQAGAATGFDINTSVGYNGIKGSEGATGRTPYAAIRPLLAEIADIVDSSEERNLIEINTTQGIQPRSSENILDNLGHGSNGSLTDFEKGVVDEMFGRSITAPEATKTKSDKNSTN